MISNINLLSLKAKSKKKMLSLPWFCMSTQLLSCIDCKHLNLECHYVIIPFCF
ncbi:hypothetical protein DAPPUDRAFT_314425 [Daphnia pulex]|uniref:Uncharacterized protein n=1 Tax=Daphnia pulex TaxID=6669 RepID=E9G645_DAPPU|nr:hypothetical protein DAPPUDRAFT_314425 [Daphnia pulex]|eukprot:EFX85056.1 hypothetical protein DAPPUDRAFT_314425 [Daphnia pulex]